MNKTTKYIFSLSGVFGGVAVIALILIILLLSDSFNYRSVYIVNPEFESKNLCLDEVEILHSLEKKGLLTTPDQYANNIASYYNTFVAFLTILFVIFSFLSYFSIKNISKKEIETNVELALKDMLRDSITFRETVLNSVYGKFEENFVNTEDFSNEIRNIEIQLEKIKISRGIEDNGAEESAEEVE